MTISSVTGVWTSLGTASATAAPATAQSASAGSAATSASAVYYPSPVTTTDPVTGALIQEWRDPTTGDELYQSPTRAAQLYGKSQDSTGPASSAAPAPAQTGTSRGGGVGLLT